MKGNVPLILSLFVILSINQVDAQNRFIAHPASISDQDHSQIRESLNDYQILTFDFESINQFVKSDKANLRLDLKITDELDFELILEENDMRSPDYKGIVTTDDGIIEDIFECNTYKGYVRNNPSQAVRLSIASNQLKGFIKLKDDYLFLESISSFAGQNKEDHKLVVFRNSDVKPDPEKRCGVTALQESKYLESLKEMTPTQQLAIAGEEHWVVELATEADAEWFNMFGANSNQEILNELNLVEGVYENTFDLYFLVVFQNVWTNVATDPYVSNDALGILNEIRTEWENNRTNVHRDLVLHFTDKNVLGGVLGASVGIGTLCVSPEDSYVFSTDYFATFYTVAHEIGHTIGGLDNTDGENCNNLNRTIMCQGETTNNFVFSNASENRMNNFLDANAWGCLRGFIAVSGGHERVCDDRQTAFTLWDNNTPNTTVSWQTSSSLQVDGNSGNSIYVKATGPGSGIGWVQYTLTSNTTGEQVQIRRENIPIGPEPANFSISSFPSCANVNQVITLVANISNVTYNWNVNGGTILSGLGNQSIDVRMGSGGFMSAHCSVTGNEDCGGPAGISSTFIGPCFGFASADSAVNVFPNPASNTLNIELFNEPAGKSFSIEILDRFGVSIKRESSQTGGDTKINTGELSDGLYFLKIVNDKGILVRRIVIERG